jgi:hypothetical protein
MFSDSNRKWIGPVVPAQPAFAPERRRTLTDPSGSPRRTSSAWVRLWLMVGRGGECEATGPDHGRLVRFLAACCRRRSSSPSASVWRGARETPEVARSTARVGTEVFLTEDGLILMQ